MGYRGGGPPQMQVQMIPFTKVVKRLVIANVAAWLVLQVILEQFILNDQLITYYFGLVPQLMFQKFFLWQPFTYMFLHDLSPFHILFNMLLLWWLGAELELLWGSRFFTLYYFVCGVGAAIIYFVVSVFSAIAFGKLYSLAIPVIGASGAVFGLMLAYGIVFGERIVYFMFIFPMKARYFVMILGAIEVVMLLNNGIAGGRVANLAHLGGLASGFLFLIGWSQYQKRRRAKGSRRGRRLRLVVDNELDDRGKKDPKYWN